MAIAHDHQSGDLVKSQRITFGPHVVEVEKCRICGDVHTTIDGKRVKTITITHGVERIGAFYGGCGYLVHGETEVVWDHGSWYGDSRSFEVTDLEQR